MISIIATSLEPVMIMPSTYIRMYMMLEVLLYIKSDKFALLPRNPNCINIVTKRENHWQGAVQVHIRSV
jgi:hypothetical protein